MMRRLASTLTLALLAGALALPARAADPVRVLVVDGQNNHNWKAGTPLLVKILEKSGRFDVDVATSPAKGSPVSAWDTFRPAFGKYQVVVSNYNGEPWPAPVQKALESFVSSGGGLVVVHAANNAFPDWNEWNQMIGLGWRNADYGDRVTVDDSGKQVRTAKGEGPGSGHGPQHAYTMRTLDPNHPITKGLPAEWMHAKDELYHGQRGPGANMHILASAFSAKDKGGTGTNEPMAWTIPFGKGRVYTLLLGHNMGEETTAMECVGFQTLLNRGTEWAATGEVTLPVPADFPTAESSRLAKP